MSVGHEHHHHGDAASTSEWRLTAVLLLTASYMLAEVIGGVLVHSLALVADAGHMLMDSLGLGMALFALRFARRPATPRKTYGFYRAEILAAMLNSLALFGIAGYVLYEAWHRLGDPPDIQSLPMLLIGLGGLIVNLLGVWILHGHTGESINLRAAFNEVLADLLGSAAVIVSGLVILLTGWWPIDPIASVLIGLYIVPRAWQLLTTALDVLLESAPANIDLDALEHAMADVPGVTAVHDLHIWTITSGFIAMSGHVVARDRRGAEILHDLRVLLREQFSIEHATIQVELSDHADDGACCTLDPRCLVISQTPLPWLAPAARVDPQHRH
ncbi:MAG: cation diffusion facilitator family transporter [Chloroflexota bacterium]